MWFFRGSREICLNLLFYVKDYCSNMKLDQLFKTNIKIAYSAAQSSRDFMILFWNIAEAAVSLCSTEFAFFVIHIWVS